MTDTLCLERKKVLANRTILVKVKGKIIEDTSVLQNYCESKKRDVLIMKINGVVRHMQNHF